jgi:plastocyanin
MRRLALLITAVLAVAAAPSAASAATKSVSILKTGFSPTSVSITVGDTVKWTNKDTVNHQVVSNTGAFVSPILGPNKTYSFVFKAAGMYRYHDGLKATLKGTVVVKGAPPAVTLGASTPIILYGTEIHLTGVVSSGKTGESVTLSYQPYPQSSYVQLAIVTTTTNGAWDYITKPTILTSYQAKYKNANSQPVTVSLKPRVTFQPAGRGYWRTTVTAGRSYAGKAVYLQRLSSFGQWVNLRKLKLGSQSGRNFKLPRVVGVSRYRMFITVNQAGAGYLASWSGTQTVRIRRK